MSAIGLAIGVPWFKRKAIYHCAANKVADALAIAIRAADGSAVVNTKCYKAYLTSNLVGPSLAECYAMQTEIALVGAGVANSDINTQCLENYLTSNLV